MKKTAVYKIVLAGLLFALAIAFSVLESWVTPFLGLPPGVKLGLANIVVVFALQFLTRRHALSLVVLKALFSFMTRGGMAGLLSLSGGLLSLLLMVLLLLQKKQPSQLMLSVLGAVGHNLGQLLVVCLVLGLAFIAYAPVLLLSGIGMGVLNAVLMRTLAPALKKINTGTGQDFTE